MESKATSHNIEVVLTIDGKEFRKGIALSPDILQYADGIYVQIRMVNALAKGIEMTIKEELGNQGEPAFIESSRLSKSWVD